MVHGPPFLRLIPGMGPAYKASIIDISAGRLVYYTGANVFPITSI